MKMPNPIAIRFAKLIFSILSITVLGVIFAMISHDHMVRSHRPVSAMAAIPAIHTLMRMG